MDDEVSRRGKGKRWTLLQTFPLATLMASFCEERSYSKGPKTVSSDSRTHYYSCSIKGCTKEFRRNFYPPQNGLGFDVYMIEHIESNQHNHDAAEVVERVRKIFWLFAKLKEQILILMSLIQISKLGSTPAQKRMILWCNERRFGAPSRVQQEFQRAALVSAENNEEAVPEPSVAKISHFLSYHRQKLIGGVRVGQTSLQDIQRFEELNQYGEFI